MCSYIPPSSFPISEALWQPARKHAPGESLKPLYVFSTNMANKAAESVLRGKYDNIIQFHQAQPKGPGFLRLPQPKSQSESSTTKGGETAESEEATSSRLHKRQTSRPSTEDGTMVKKLRSGLRNRSESQTAEESKSPPHAPASSLRYSRRLRRQKADSTGSSPSSPMSQKSPSPTPPSNQRSTRSRASFQRSEITTPQRSTRSRRIPSQENLSKGSPPKPPSTTDHKEDLENSQQTGEESTLSADEEQEQPPSVSKDMGNQEKSVSGNRKEESQHSPLSPSPRETDTTSVPPTSQDEVNYTICHGTPVSKSPATDISSPKAWEQQQRQRHHYSQQQQQPQQLQGQQTSHSTSNPASVESAFSPCADPASASHAFPQYTPVSAHAHHLIGREQTMGLPHHISLVDQQLHKEQNNWSANLASQFPGYVQTMYNPGLAPMYPPHAAQAMAAPNYPYPMPYPWGHHAHHMGSHGDHMMQHHQHHRSAKSLHEQSGTSSVTGELLQHPRSMDVVQPQHLSQLSHTPQGNLMQQAVPSSLPSRPSDMNKEPTSFSPDMNASTSSLSKPPMMEKMPVASTAGLPPPPTLHQFPTPGSAQHHHQVQHAFSRPPHALTPEHIPHGTPTHPHAPGFPYGFEPGAHSISAMHMWQQSQMQPAMRPIPGMHPSHLQPHLATPSLWYSQPMAPLMPGVGEVPSSGGDHSKVGKKSAKSGGKSSQMDGSGSQAKLNQNSNNSNNTSQAHTSQPNHALNTSAQLLYAAQYQAQAFAPRSAWFSVEHLTGSSPVQLKEAAVQTSQVARGATWVPPTVGTETNADIHSRVVASVESVKSSILSQNTGSTWVPPTVGTETNADFHSRVVASIGSVKAPANGSVKSSNPSQNTGQRRVAPHPLLLVQENRRHTTGAAGIFEEQEDLPTSAILERTRRSSEFADMDGECIVREMNSFPS